jgi:hypothetical protein
MNILLCYVYFYESLILHIRFDVGLVDVVIFDCYVFKIKITSFCVLSCLFFYEYFSILFYIF